jgi:dolichol-phosphate mannosyltransferase
LKHLRRLYIFKYGVWTQLMQFLFVGLLGTIVNLVILTLLLAGRTPVRVAVAAAILVSMCSNFVLNRRFSFSFARRGPWFRQFLSFVAASSMGAAINYALTIWVHTHFPSWRPQVAAMIGILVGTGVNFAASRYLVFRASHVRVGPEPKSPTG